MEGVAIVGVRPRDRVVELDAEAGSVRREDMPVLPADRRPQKRPVEAVEALDALEDQEIRDGEAEMDVGRRLDRPAIEMRCDLGAARLRHRRDLLRLEDAADAPER